MLDYPQMPAMSDNEITALLEQPLLAKIGTHNSDGTIHIVPLLFKYHQGTIILGTQDITRKVKNIMNNPTTTVLVDTPTQPSKGVMMYGLSSLEYDDVLAKRIAIFSNYMDQQQAELVAHGLAQKWKPVIIRFTPEQFISYDYSKGSLI